MIAACGEDPAATAVNLEGARIALRFENLPPLDPAREGRYVAWLDAAGTFHSAGTVTLDASGRATVTSPVPRADAIEITVEPPDDVDPAPSPRRLLRGRLRGTRATLSIDGAVTIGEARPLRPDPGQFTMFTPSDNFRNGYPSHENAGVWLFNSRPRQTPQQDHWVRLTPLRPGWVYEGWMVRDLGTPAAVWLSYGKFRPDDTGTVNSRDDTGWGPFSGVEDFDTAGEEEYPGDDWISNPLAFPVPGNLELPLDLTERTGTGANRWTHLITIEPATDGGEPISSERPFLLRPYRDAFGVVAPGEPRAITFRAEDLPRGTAEVVR